MDYADIVSEGGGVFRGVMGEVEPTIVLFDSPTTGSTLALPLRGLTVYGVQQHITESDAKWEPYIEMEMRLSG